MSLGHTIIKVLPKNVHPVWKLVDFTLDTDYPTGGYPIAASDLGLKTLLAIVPLGGEAGFIPVWDRSAGKLKMFNMGGDTDPMDQCAADLDALEDKVITCLVLGY